ncbi:DUF1254 domain-containing protein [Variovorax robiniae]|uniref:DUF1254 domain-containing protein n=1 Tax=Variovorax robiniae TaxID=1836199 RepID=A0ABU8XC32_9BURK
MPPFQKLLAIPAIVSLFAMTNLAHAQPAATATSGATVPVTIDNFVRSESDRYLKTLATQGGGVGKLMHRRTLASIERQPIIRLNRDTLYSSGVFDLDAGPVTIRMPDAGKRYMSMQVISQDHYVPYMVDTAGTYTLTRAGVGTRYAAVGIRTLADPADPADLRAAYALQDAVEVTQASPGKLVLPDWDPVSHKKVRDALLVLAGTAPDFNKAFGTKEEVDPVRRLFGSAAAWGGIPEKNASYLNVTPARNDGTTVYRLTVKDVPVDGFWSVSVYNADGYYEKNAANAYTLNNLTARKSADGSIAIQFGGCDAQAANCLPIMAGWNYTVRLYRPRAEILEGRWSFPVAQPDSPQ